MKIYLDSREHSNLSEITDATVDTINQLPLYERAGFIPNYTKYYLEPGIYPISVKNHCDWWSGKNPHGPNRHVLYEVPPAVIQAAQNNKLIIVIDQQAEGFTLNEMQNVDGFKELHDVMHNLKLPKNSVLFIDGNSNFENEYTTWCVYNNLMPMVAHCPFFTHTFYFHGKFPLTPLINDAIVNPKSRMFNSLNRTVRPSRVAHLFKLIFNKWHEEGLVSGHWTNDASNPNAGFPKPYFLDVPDKVFQSIMLEKLPLFADGDFCTSSNLTPDTSKDTIFNHEIYKNSLLSFVTETSFHRSGMFLTEKTFKPIVAGHPFIILGQYRVLDTLRSMGYLIDFPGIDQTYDTIQNATDRFEACHASLEKWLKYTKDEKIKYLNLSMPMIKHNQDLFKNSNYEMDSFRRLKSKVDVIFKKFAIQNDKN